MLSDVCTQSSLFVANSQEWDEEGIFYKESETLER